MNEGKKFEQDFTKSCEFFTYRLRDAGGWSDADNTRFTPSNLCDMIGFKDGRLLLMELKSCGGTSIPFANMKQLEAMNKVSYEGVYPIFVLNFRQFGRTYFIKASKLMELKETCGKKSINYLDIELHGTLIRQTLKRTRYQYDTTIL